WSRGHMADWNDFAKEADDEAWSYASVLELYKRIENWQGRPDRIRRGKSGPLFVQSSPDPHSLAKAGLNAFARSGIPLFGAQNGEMMEGLAGTSITEICVREGKRQSAYSAYLRPIVGRKNLV